MLNTDGRHPGIQEFRDAFEFDHLSEGLPRIVAASYHDQAARLLALLPDAAPLTRAIHGLWQSKNEAVLLATRVRTDGNGGAQPPVTFRGTTNPAHATAPVVRTDLVAFHPDRQPGRPDTARNPFDQPWFTPVTVPGSSGEPIDVTTYSDMAEQAAAAEEDNDDLVRGGVGPKVYRPETIEPRNQDDGSPGRHTLNEPPRSGLSFVNDAGDPVSWFRGSIVFPAQRPGTDASE